MSVNPMDDDESLPPNVFDYVSRDAVEDLWGIGYTVVRRAVGDPFAVPPQMVPATRRYQWWHLVHDQMYFRRLPGAAPSGWAPVPASRHDGYFMPFGHQGDIEVGGLGLFEKSKFEVDQELAQGAAAAHQLVADWAKSAGDQGISGEVNIGGVGLQIGPEGDRDVYASSKNKTVETTVKIPKDMVPHMAAIFEERDRLKDEILMPDRSLRPGVIADKFYREIDHNPSAPWWPTLHAILLPLAIQNVREKLEEEKTDG